MPEREQAADDETPSAVRSLRGLLARLTHPIRPDQAAPRKRPDEKTGRPEVRGD
ncbi:MAG TPA: hypothetical protein VGK78_09310 [Nocardioides sp.]|uniref:hypothetical protein n=1 Tax=Nocardioides sp. TaxID=35761 RepID=UPI002F401FA1